MASEIIRNVNAVVCVVVGNGRRKENIGRAGGFAALG